MWSNCKQFVILLWIWSCLKWSAVVLDWWRAIYSKEVHWADIINRYLCKEPLLDTCSNYCDSYTTIWIAVVRWNWHWKGMKISCVKVLQHRRIWISKFFVCSPILKLCWRLWVIPTYEKLPIDVGIKFPPCSCDPLAHLSLPWVLQYMYILSRLHLLQTTKIISDPTVQWTWMGK